MRRFMVLVTVVMLTAAMMVFAAPASAVGEGCKEFGAIPLFEIQLEGIEVFVNQVTTGAQGGGAANDVNDLKEFSESDDPPGDCRYEE